MTEKLQPGTTRTFSGLMTSLRANGIPEEEIKKIIPPEMYEAPEDK